MDLAIGAKRVFVMMELQTKTGESKLVERCTYPLTGVGCVSRVYTDLAVIDVDAGALRVREMAEGISLPELERIVGLSLTAA
jgi:3-oxoadipate CoA-transferase beta subunit